MYSHYVECINSQLDDIFNLPYMVHHVYSFGLVTNQIAVPFSCTPVQIHTPVIIFPDVLQCLVD